jgi:hypothetical protein
MLATHTHLSYNVHSTLNLKEIMDINLLVQRLKHGDSYTVQDGDNDPYQVNRPPNHLMIKAADVIMQMDRQLQHYSAVVNNLQNQLNELAQQYETLRNINTTSASS